MPQVDDATAAGRLAGRHAIFLIVLLILGSRLVMLGAGHVWINSPEYNQSPPQLGFEAQLERYRFSDVRWYQEIRDEGYEKRPYTEGRQANWAFFPAWPLLWRVIDDVSDDVAGALVLNTALFTVACAFAYNLLRNELGRRTALHAAVLLIVFPGAQFTMRPGPESLFLAASTVAIWAASRRGQWWALAAAGAVLATMSRPQGIVVLVPLAMLAVMQRKRGDRLSPYAVGTFLLPIGALVVFGLHLRDLTGNALAMFETHKAWDNGFALPFVALGQAVWHLAHQRLFDYYGFNLVPLSLAVLIAGVALSAWGWKERVLSTPLLAYGTAMLLVVLTRDSTQAAVRSVIVIFPLFGLAAAWLDRRSILYTGIVAIFAATSVFSYVAFVDQLLWATT
ncbi:MAG: glycosyltransferase family 39 protein [Acidimicrobiia bacterium]